MVGFLTEGLYSILSVIALLSMTSVGIESEFVETFLLGKASVAVGLF